MKNWDDLRYLIAVHKTGSMSAAARLLDTNPATVSRRLGRLGESLGFDLFVKTPDGWVANAMIADLIDSATTFENQIETFLNVRDAPGDVGAGKVSIGCPPSLTSHLLFPRLDQLKKAWPKVSVAFHSQMFTAALGENDLILVPARPTQGRLVVRFVGRLRVNVFCYPDSPRDDSWIGLVREHEAFAPMQRAREIMNGTEPVFRVETMHEVLSSVRATRLPGLMPYLSAAQDPDLVKFDPKAEDLEAQIYLCFHETRRRDPLIRAVADWIVTAFDENPDL